MCVRPYFRMSRFCATLPSAKNLVSVTLGSKPPFAANFTSGLTGLDAGSKSGDVRGLKFDSNLGFDARAERVFDQFHLGHQIGAFDQFFFGVSAR